jgi:sugar porter (SP) family MFS transporter
LPAVLFLGFLLAVPESPRWLVQRGRTDEAARILARIGGAKQAARDLEEIREAIRLESGSLNQLFQPRMRYVLVLGVVLAVLQQVTGINVFMYYAPEIFKQLGSESSAALLQTVVVGATNVLFTLVAIRTVDRWGRKPLMIVGSAGMGISLLGISVAALAQRTDVWVLVFVLSYIASFASSIGPIVWVVLAEIFPTRIRGRAMAVATFMLWTANFVVSQTFPMINESPWLQERFHGAFPFWLYAAMCGVTVIVILRFLPETKGKTLEEIERFWLENR